MIVMLLCLLFSFSTLKAGRDAAASARLHEYALSEEAFSTLKAGRDSAASAAIFYFVGGIILSVPSKRVETLPQCF